MALQPKWKRSPLEIQRPQFASISLGKGERPGRKNYLCVAYYRSTCRIVLETPLTKSRIEDRTFDHHRHIAVTNIEREQDNNRGFRRVSRLVREPFLRICRIAWQRGPLRNPRKRAMGGRPMALSQRRGKLCDDSEKLTNGYLSLIVNLGAFLGPDYEPAYFWVWAMF